MDEFFREDRDDPFFVKNLERVQGDERDSILISVGYSKLPDGRMRYMFGPLNRAGGERRLNVAITRARKTCKIISSFSATDMDPNRLKVNGTRMLKAYLEYTDSGGSDLGSASQVKPKLNPFERDVQDAMHKRGIKNVAQYGSSGYWIDFAAMHPERLGEPVLAIEADGASYHSSYSARDRDRLRQENLERQGWEFHRIWSTEWFRHKEDEIDRLEESYHRAIAKRDGDSSRSEPDVPPDDSPDPARLTTPQLGRSGNPPSIGRSKIDDYSEREIRNLLNWIESDGLLRTKFELFDEAVKSLGFARRGPRITERLAISIEDERARRPIRPDSPSRTRSSSPLKRPHSKPSGARSSRTKTSVRAMNTSKINNVLIRAMGTMQSVQISYSDAQGRRSSRTISNIVMNGKYVYALDSRSREKRTFVVSRIISAVLTS